MIDKIERRPAVPREEVAERINWALTDSQPRTVPEIQRLIRDKYDLDLSVSQIHNGFHYIRHSGKGIHPHLRLLSEQHAERSTHRLEGNRDEIRKYVMAQMKSMGSVTTTLLQQVMATNGLSGASLDDLQQTIEHALFYIYGMHPDPEKFAEVVERRTGRDITTGRAEPAKLAAANHP